MGKKLIKRKKIKYLRITLTREAKGLYNKHVKTLKKEIERNKKQRPFQT